MGSKHFCDACEKPVASPDELTLLSLRELGDDTGDVLVPGCRADVCTPCAEDMKRELATAFQQAAAAAIANRTREAVEIA